MRKKKNISLKSIFQKYSINQPIGKRKFKVATPYAVQRFLKANNKLTPVLNQHLNFLRQEYRKIKNKNLKNYSKRWQSRYINQLNKIIDQTHLIYDRFNFVKDNESLPEFDMYEFMSGIEPDSGDSPANKWRTAVDYYFNGDEKAARKSFDLYSAYHNAKK